MIETVRVSQRARDQLITLKRRTGIAQWNVLCRWALCRSLAEATPPARTDIPLDSNVEMDWKTFAGPHGDIYWALVRQRCGEDGLPATDGVLAEQFKLHLHRGIGYLSGDKTLVGVEQLVELAVRSPAA